MSPRLVVAGRKGEEGCSVARVEEGGVRGQRRGSHHQAVAVHIRGMHSDLEGLSLIKRLGTDWIQDRRLIYVHHRYLHHLAINGSMSVSGVEGDFIEACLRPIRVEHKGTSPVSGINKLGVGRNV